ncbi:uncharacterized protein LOC130458130 [Monodelphis domestica]|uniref:uncharacterized protein LOC130458130 n=1 Tax=Monodelphis domestica TaxID=13616 RepID=UPI0024E236CE|nr:uncharacterized protein LOC130458130 [Monodelphis domestica]
MRDIGLKSSSAEETFWNNEEISDVWLRLAAVDEINAVIREGHPSNTVMALMKPEAQLPTVHPFAAVLYQDELFNLQNQSSLNYLAPEELSTTVEKVSAVALLNQALETEDLELTQDRLRNPSIDFKNLDEAHLERYASRLMSIKRESSSQGQDNLSRNEIQNHIDIIYVEIQEEKSRLAAIDEINAVIREGHPSKTMSALMKPEAQLPTVHPFAADLYQDELFNLQKQSSLNYLTAEELATTVEMVSGVALLNQALETKDHVFIHNQLQNPSIGFNKVDKEHLEWYATRLMSIKREASSQGQDNLSRDEIQNLIDIFYVEIQEEKARLAAVDKINAVIREGHPSNTVMALMKPEAKLPTIHPFAAVLYQDELFNLQKQSSLNYLAPEELAMTVKVVSGVALLNQALETEDLVSIQHHLQHPSIGFHNLDEEHLERYASRLMSIKREASSHGQDILSRNEIQNHIDIFYVEIQEEKARLAAIDEINAVIREGHPSNTVMALMKPEAQLPTVHPFAAVLYQDELFNLQKQSSLNYLAAKELAMTVKMVSGVALLNKALEMEDLVSVQNHLQNPSIDFHNLNEEHLERYAIRLISIKRETSSKGQDKLSRNEIQNLIDIIYVEIQEEKSRLAAVDEINAVIREGHPSNTVMALMKPEAQLPTVHPFAAVLYQDELFNLQKQSSLNYLAAEELAMTIEMVSGVALLNQALETKDLLSTQNHLQNPSIGFNKVDKEYLEWYSSRLMAIKREASSQGQDNLRRDEIQNHIDIVYVEIQEEKARLAAINEINAVIREGDPSNTVMALMKPEAQLPTVHPFAAVLYQDELFDLQKQSSLNYLAAEELAMTVEMVSGVALLNQALETEDLVFIQNQLQNPSIGFNNLNEEHLERYASRLMSIKREASSQGQDNLRRDEIQNHIDIIYVEIQEEKARLAAIDEINAVIREGHPSKTMSALMKPEAQLPTVHPFAADLYQDELFNLQKQSSLNYLTAEELAMTVEMVSGVALLNQALETEDLVFIQKQLQNPSIGFNNLDEEHLEWYASRLMSIKREASSQGQDNLSRDEIQNLIDIFYVEIQEEKARLAAVDEINAVIREGHPSNTVMALMKPEAQLPTVHPFAAVLYQDELFNLQKQSSLNYLTVEELAMTVEMVSGVALLNRALETEDLVSIQNHLQNPSLGFNNLDEEYLQWYASRLMSIKREASSQGQDNLRRDEIQNHIDIVYVEIKEEKARLAAVDEINAVIREGHPSNTVMALMKPEAQLPTVHPFAAVLYQDELFNLQEQSSLVSAGGLWLHE